MLSLSKVPKPTKLIAAIILAAFLSHPCLGISPSQSVNKSESFSFTILHSNDIHSHEDSFLENGKNVGGMSRIAYLIKNLKKNNPKVLAVDAGDVFQGTAFFENYKGETDIECLSQAGYDIFTPGNHDFDEGPENLAKQLKNAKFDVINCNLDLSGVPALKELVKPSVIKTIDGEKVAFVGVITPALKELVNKLGDVKFLSPSEKWMQPVRDEVERLKKLGINKIVLVSHCGVDLEKSLAAIEGVDLVIGGHSHTRLDKAVVVEQANGEKAMVVQTGCYGRALGRLDLVFDKEGKIVLPDSTYRLINITDKVFEDPQLKAYVTEKGKPFEYLTKTILSHATARFDGRFKRYDWDSPIGDLICDALFEKAIENGATITLQNRGGIRGGLDEGPVSLEKVREILPFPNKLVVATVTGKTLVAALEHSVERSGTGGPFFDLHGIKHAWDPGLPAGQRIVFAQAQNKEGDYEPIVPDELYRIGINDYSFNGGEGYDFKDAKDLVNTGARLSDALEEYLKKRKTISPALPTRFLRVTSGVAKLSGSGDSLKLLIEGAPPDAELSIFSGSARSVSFLKKFGVLPLANARLLRSSEIGPDGRLELGVSELLGGKRSKGNKSETWLAVLLKSRDENGDTRRTVSVPLKAY